LNARELVLDLDIGRLIREGRVQMMGAIRQELLSGIREEERFHNLNAGVRLLGCRRA
jgi:hypothetical protein